MANAVELVKKAAVDAVEAGKPVSLLFGTVVSAAPLAVNISQKMTLGEANLVLSQNVTRRTVDAAADFETEPALTGGEQEHRHTVQGVLQVVVNKPLEAGERVILARMQGGKKFIILDRLGAGL
ncbi:MAG TPA: DUF2577 domain-containing protein [Candidatus Fimivivens faecavium]|nr:DUF2577 domain-containing protein [Candidatus Fimivivens faecavium]